MHDIMEKFNDIISKILLLEIEQISDDISRDGIEEWDSMTHLVLISDLEQAFEIIFTDDEVSEIKTIGDLKRALKKHGIQLK